MMTLVMATGVLKTTSDRLQTYTPKTETQAYKRKPHQESQVWSKGRGSPGLAANQIKARRMHTDRNNGGTQATQALCN